jgi:kynurenine formamidase
MPLTPELVELAAKVSNWGRWGDDDQLGTLNLVDAEAVRRGAAAVRRGAAFSLAVRLDQQSPQVGSIPGRLNPLRTMIAVNAAYEGTPEGFCVNDDVVTMGLQAATHWDALAHVSYDGLIYNGVAATTVTADGAARCGIDRVRTVTTRGVLLDVARATGVERLRPGHAISSAELDAAATIAGVAALPGDAVLVRTGNMQLFHAGNRKAYTLGEQPGLSVDTIPWLRDRDVAAVATDTVALEAYPCVPAGTMFPVHMIQLRDMGLTQGQNFDLEALAADCAADGVYEFLLEASPLPFTGGLGSPVNPVAVK